MERRIFKRLCLIALLTLVISTISSLTIYYNFYKGSSERDLINLTEIIKINLNDTDSDIAYLNNIKNIDDEIRISYFDENADVLFDSKKDISKMTNHSDRPEIIDANKYGMSDTKRYSNTFSKNNYYVAIKINNGNIIRLSRENENIFGAFLKVLPLDILLSVVIFIFAIILSKYATRKILEPLNEKTSDLNSIDVDEFPEIAPFIRQIKYQNNTIKAQLYEMQNDKDTITTLLENMREGIIILDRFKSILVINESTSEFLNCKEDIVGEHFLNLTRNEELINAISKGYDGIESEGIIDISNKSIKYILNTIYNNEKLTGVIVLLIDETESIRIKNIREEFSANVSHELKTPLTSIYGFSELLKNNMIEDEKDKFEIENRIFEEANRLLILIDDIIKISSMEKDEEIVKVSIDLKSLSEKILDNFKEKAKEKNITLELEGEANIFANSTMMWELITNLVDNSIKYNKEYGFVRISLNENKDFVKISIKDSGIGISKEDQNRIFERFYRVDKSRSKKSGGTGLGLSIVKHIILAHNGDIEIESMENVGTTISAIFPK